MNKLGDRSGGSRFLFEPFEYGPQTVREAQEKVLQMQFSAIESRLDRIEGLMERLERRLWLTVYGVVGTILAQAARSLLTITPNGGL